MNSRMMERRMQRKLHVRCVWSEGKGGYYLKALSIAINPSYSNNP